MYRRQQSNKKEFTTKKVRRRHVGLQHIHRTSHENIHYYEY